MEAGRAARLHATLSALLLRPLPASAAALSQEQQTEVLSAQLARELRASRSLVALALQALDLACASLEGRRAEADELCGQLLRRPELVGGLGEAGFWAGSAEGDLVHSCARLLRAHQGPASAHPPALSDREGGVVGGGGVGGGRGGGDAWRCAREDRGARVGVGLGAEHEWLAETREVEEQVHAELAAKLRALGAGRDAEPVGKSTRRLEAEVAGLEARLEGLERDLALERACRRQLSACVDFAGSASDLPLLEARLAFLEDKADDERLAVARQRDDAGAARALGVVVDMERCAVVLQDKIELVKLRARSGSAQACAHKLQVRFSAVQRPTDLYGGN